MPMKNPNEIDYPGWEIIGELGSGSFGTVYKIERDIDGGCEKAALKVISIPKDKSEINELRMKNYDDSGITTHYEELKDKVINECKIMMRLQDCEYIVKCRKYKSKRVDENRWNVFIEMELLTSLENRLKSEFLETDVLDLGIDLSRALIACQKEGITHRDIKPQNIFVSEDGKYKLGDFGIARTLGGSTQSATRGAGTYDYIAPEVQNSEHYSNKSDICSLGIVMYMLLNERRLPFEPLPPELPKAGYDYTAIRLKGITPPEPKNGSPYLKSVILKACAFNPEDRYQTAEELLADLEAVRDGSTPLAYGASAISSYSGSASTGTSYPFGKGSNSGTKGTARPFGKEQKRETEPPKPKKQPKVLIGIAALMGVLILSYYNIHFWQPATCTAPKTCSICGKTEGAALGHSWSEATYFAPKFCPVCGEIEGTKIPVNVGDYITFGSYEQDNISSNGKEPIEWLVLDKKNSAALLISRYLLDWKQYDNSWEIHKSWEMCTLRTWLNEEFLNTAFLPEEQRQILTTTVTADKNPNYNTEQGNSTSDKVFLLSIMEANKYFLSDSSRICKSTEAAVAKNPLDADRWLLRSLGEDNLCVAQVNIYGHIIYSGYYTGSPYGIRPALWVLF